MGILQACSDSSFLTEVDGHVSCLNTSQGSSDPTVLIETDDRITRLSEGPMFIKIDEHMTRLLIHPMLVDIDKDITRLLRLSHAN